MPVINARRNLNTQIEADDFFANVLGDYEDDGELAARIVAAELGLYALEDRPTISHKDYRVAKYRTERDREKLNGQILKELINLPRLDNDDDICLGIGGAKPAEIQSKAQAYIVSGPPASGKSGIASTLADNEGAYILDSDYAKRKYLEYHFYDGGASLVHKESDKVTFDGDTNLFEYCIYNRYNIVLPLVGRTYESMVSICKKLIEAKYSVHIVNVVLDRTKCVSRALNRYRETKRYVPLSYIFDEVGSEPELVYHRLKRDFSKRKGIVSFTQYSTDVPRGAPPKLLEKTKSRNVIIKRSDISGEDD